jgi:cell wall-associated NlpC family hydrolase
MKKTTGAVVGLMATGLLLAVPLVAAVDDAAQAACSHGSTQPLDSDTVASEVESILKGGSAGSVTVPGLDDPAEQAPNARTIQATGIAMGIPPRGQVVALATALQESGLRNLAYGDRDSLGLFQQRPSQGWGTAVQILDPVHASTRFYEALVHVSGWQSLTIAQAAQAVQQSGFPDAYAKWEPLATALQKAIGAVLAPTGGDLAPPSPEPGTSSITMRPDVDGSCSSGGDGTGFGAIPAGSLPAGYALPADASTAVQTAIRWALGQLGTDYQWGGSCTAARGPDPMGRCDCSSLVQQAYRAGGVALPRTTYTQVKAGQPVSVNALKPGDLLFTEGTASAPEHVGMYIGQGLVVAAPRTGAVVDVTALAEWRPQILAARRIA